MAYKVILTLVSGQTAARTDLGQGSTPKVGDWITVRYGVSIARAQVTAVRLKQGVDGSDEVDAQEM